MVKTIILTCIFLVTSIEQVFSQVENQPAPPAMTIDNIWTGIRSVQDKFVATSFNQFLLSKRKAAERTVIEAYEEAKTRAYNKNEELLAQRRAFEEKHEVDLSLGLQTLPETQDQAENPCVLRYVWGHGKHTQDVIKNFRPSSFIGMGCKIGLRGKVRGALSQDGYNGGWNESLRSDSNGSMNPILLKSSVALRGKDEEKFQKNELGAILDQLTLEQHGPPQVSAGARQVTSVGFMRLATYSWYALLNRARELNVNRCGAIRVDFICSSDGKESEYGTKGWEYRIKAAKEASLFSEVEGKTIGLHPRLCGSDFNGKAVRNVPQVCGESYYFDSRSLNEISGGSCGKYVDYFVSDNYLQSIKSGK